MEDPAYRKLMDYAMRALGQRAHTESELRKKLKKRPHHTDKFEVQIIDRLKDLNLLNDEDFIKRTIEDAINFRYHGRLKVVQKLQHKGIPKKQTKAIWTSMKIDEKKVASAALKKAGKRFAKTPKEKLYHKRLQFLAARGFSAAVVFDLAKP
jgi:regulatory protein